MIIISKYKTILAVVFALASLSCHDKPKKIKVQEVHIQDVVQEESNVEPPPPPPPKREVIDRKENRCYVNYGLKYTTIITLVIRNDTAMGIISSIDIESGREQRTTFDGIINGDRITIHPDGALPVIGAASGWTDKPWTLKKTGGKQMLEIIFNAKNYDTNKWEDTTYQFEWTGCN